MIFTQPQKKRTTEIFSIISKKKFWAKIAYAQLIVDWKTDREQKITQI